MTIENFIDRCESVGDVFLANWTPREIDEIQLIAWNLVQDEGLNPEDNIDVTLALGEAEDIYFGG